MASSSSWSELMRDDRFAGAGELVDEFVDGNLRADIDALGRLVEDQDIRIRKQPARDDDLLLIAA
jgi:hypothetical protein